MWFFKRKKGLQVKAAIQDDCYQKLPDTLKSRFFAAPEDTEPTHTVEVPEDEKGGFWLSEMDVLGGLAFSLGSESTPTENYDTSEADVPSIDTGTDTGGDFGGGDGGGAGAGDSY